MDIHLNSDGIPARLIRKDPNIKTSKKDRSNNKPNNIFRLMVSEENSIFFIACGKQ
jgi:hypothetical protein